MSFSGNPIFDPSVTSSPSARPQPTDDFGKVSSNIVTVIRWITELDKMVGDLGGPKDGPLLRNYLKTKREDTQRVINETKRILSMPAIMADRVKYEKLARQFNDCVADYERSSKLSLRREREIVAKIRQSQLEVDGAKVADEALSLEQLQLTEIRASEIDNEILRERNADIQQIQRDLEELANVFIDVHEEIEEQGQQLEQIEVRADMAAVYSTEGRKELVEAEKLANSARWKILVITLIVLVILAIIVILVIRYTCGIPCKPSL